MEGGNPPEGEKQQKRLNDDFLLFMKKRSGTDIPKYTSHLEKYVDLQRKRQRAEAARRHYENRKKEVSDPNDGEPKDKVDNPEHIDNDQINKKRVQNERINQKRGIKCEKCGRSRSSSWFCSNSQHEPSDRCGKRRRRRRSCGRKRRRRSCRRKRRRRSCRRKRRRRSCRRKKRSCRRKRRRSCRRKRRRRC